MAAHRKSLITLSFAAADLFFQEMDDLTLEELEQEEMESFLIALNLRNSRVAISHYSERIIELYSMHEFKSHFRLERSTFDHLLHYLHAKMQKEISVGNPEIQIEKQLQITLWLLANQEVYRTISDRFGVSLSTAWTCAQRICTTLVTNRKDFISWPDGEKARVDIAEWEKISGFPGIIGAVDGSYIPISTPCKYQESYVCRKKFHALNIQAVCSYDKKFIYVDARCPGSMYDSRALTTSSLYKALLENKREIVPYNSHLIGDTAYALRDWLLVPFKRYGDLNRNQIRFNKKLSASRVLTEQTFGLLKNRFRRLKYMNMQRTDLIPLMILSCCILHNICIDCNDVMEDVDDYTEDECDDNNEAGEETGIMKRNFIMSTFRD